MKHILIAILVISLFACTNENNKAVSMTNLKKQATETQLSNEFSTTTKDSRCKTMNDIYSNLFNFKRIWLKFTCTLHRSIADTYLQPITIQYA